MKPPKHLQSLINGAAFDGPRMLSELKLQIERLPVTMLRELQAHIVHQLAGRSTAEEERLELLMYTIMCDTLRISNGTALSPLEVFRSHGDYTMFRKACRSINEFICDQFGHAVPLDEYKQIVQLLVTIAVAHAEAMYTVMNRKTVIRALTEPASLFDAAFPGYIRNRCVGIALDAWLRTQDRRHL